MTESRQAESDDRTTQGVRTYALIWLGQIVSILGSGISRFGIGVWVFQETGSVMEYSLIFVAASLPTIVLSPLAGALVDRWDRRWVMILADSVVASATLFLLLMVVFGDLQVWQIYVLNTVASAAESFQSPALAAATTLLVPKKHLARASGAMQAGFAMAQIGSPLLAGMWIGPLGLRGLLVLDLVTFLFAMGTLFFIRIPKPRVSAEGLRSRGSLLSETLYGWRYLRKRPALLALLGYFACLNFANGMVMVLFTPLILSFTTPEVLGRVISVIGVGVLSGSVVITLWGGPRRRIPAIFLMSVFGNFVLLTGGLEPNAVLIAAAGFVFVFTGPAVNAMSQAIWQQKVEPDLQGRVFATRRMVAMLAMPLAYLVTGPLADKVFEPLMAEGGALAGVLGPYIGVGPGRGLGLMLMMLCVWGLGVSAIFWANPRLRNLEEEVPDAVGDEPPTADDEAPMAGDAAAQELPPPGAGPI